MSHPRALLLWFRVCLGAHWAHPHWFQRQCHTASLLFTLPTSLLPFLQPPVRPCLHPPVAQLLLLLSQHSCFGHLKSVLMASTNLNELKISAFSPGVCRARTLWLYSNVMYQKQLIFVASQTMLCFCWSNTTVHSVPGSGLWLTLGSYFSSASHISLLTQFCLLEKFPVTICLSASLLPTWPCSATRMTTVNQQFPPQLVLRILVSGS